jgi:DNA-binding transcriptional regulator YiaG
MDQNLADLLGIDLNDPEVQRENEAIERDMRLIESLVGIRKRLGLSQAEVAARMGRSQPAVSDFERLGGDPHLSTIRRYALAVGAEVIHLVQVRGEKTSPTLAPAAMDVHVEGPGTANTRSTTAGLPVYQVAMTGDA